MSDIGPYAIWQIPNATKKATNVAWVAAVEASRCAEIAGSAGKYISIAKGPMAVRRPSTIAFRAKVVGMSGNYPVAKNPPGAARAFTPGHGRQRLRVEDKVVRSGAGRSKDGRTNQPHNVVII